MSDIETLKNLILHQIGSDRLIAANEKDDEVRDDILRDELSLLDLVEVCENGDTHGIVDWLEDVDENLRHRVFDIIQDISDRFSLLILTIRRRKRRLAA